MGKRAYIWTAVSSEEQATGDKDSLAHQERVGREHAQRHGLDVVRVLRSDDSRSIILLSDAEQNPNLGYAELHRAIKAHDLDVLIYWNTDRLGRNRALVTAIQELCVANHIVLYDLSNPPQTLTVQAGDSTRIIWAVQAAQAQSDVEKLKERRRFGIQARAKRGVFTTSAPFGYSTADGTPQIDAAQAGIVQRIIAEYLDGHGLPRIAASLNADGIPTPKGNQWQVGTIAYVLGNVWRYAGYLESNRHSRKWRDAYARYPGQHPAIIDDATAERVIAERAARAANRRLSDTPHLLSGVVWCITCNAPMRLSTQNSGSRHVQRLTYLRCYNADAHGFWAVRTDAIMPLIDAKMRQLTEIDVDMLCAPTATPDVTAAQLDTLRREVDKLTRSLATADDDYYITGKLDAERHSRTVTRLQAEIANRHADIARLEQQQQSAADVGTRRAQLRDIMANGPAILRSADVTRANVWLRRHVRVWILNKELRPDEVVIEWLPRGESA